MASYKKIASRQDKRVAKASGLKIRPNSGAIAGHKGDLGGPNVFVETKTRASSKDHLGLDSKWLVKAKEQAFSMGKGVYFLVLSAGDDQDYAVLPWKVMRGIAAPIEDWEADYTCKGRGSYIKIPLETLDMILYRKRRMDQPPVAKVSASSLSEPIAVLYLQDLFLMYEHIPTWVPEQFQPELNDLGYTASEMEMQDLSRWLQNMDL